MPLVHRESRAVMPTLRRTDDHIVHIMVFDDEGRHPLVCDAAMGDMGVDDLANFPFDSMRNTGTFPTCLWCVAMWKL